MSRFIRVFILIGMMLLAFYVNGFAADLNTASEFDSVKSDSAQVVSSAKPPKLMDLGSKGCIPCQRMAPILEDLRVRYKGKADVIFIDVKEDRKASLKHKVTLIPTQIFFDTNGVEVYRHIGFFPADSIIAHFKAMGAEL